MIAREPVAMPETCQLLDPVQIKELDPKLKYVISKNTKRTSNDTLEFDGFTQGLMEKRPDQIDSCFARSDIK